MFRSCLQRPKSVIFEGLVIRFGYGRLRVEKKKNEEDEESSLPEG